MTVLALTVAAEVAAVVAGIVVLLRKQPWRVLIHAPYMDAAR